jgi:hypothetical protein
LIWVIVDDGEDSIEDTLIGVPNVKYVRSEPGMTIGEKRNLGVQSAMYDTIVMMDDAEHFARARQPLRRGHLDNVLPKS